MSRVRSLSLKVSVCLIQGFFLRLGHGRYPCTRSEARTRPPGSRPANAVPGGFGFLHAYRKDTRNLPPLPNSLSCCKRITSCACGRVNPIHMSRRMQTPSGYLGRASPQGH
jgi:hypothetical protein